MAVDSLGELGRAGEGLELIGPVPSSVDNLGPSQLDALVGRGVLQLWTDDLVTARSTLGRAEGGLRRYGPLYLRLIALFYLADTEYRLGQWSDAVSHSQLAVSLAGDADQVWTFALVHAIAAFPLAGQGEWDNAQLHADAAVRAARQLGDGASTLWVGMAGARLAQARGNPEAMLVALAPSASWSGWTAAMSRVSSRGGPCTPRPSSAQAASKRPRPSSPHSPSGPPMPPIPVSWCAPPASTACSWSPREAWLRRRSCWRQAVSTTRRIDRRWSTR